MSTSLMQARSKLMKSFSKNDQLNMGGAAYVFRVNLGTFGKHDTPANLYDEPNLITVPRTENNTIYLAGLFYSLDEATKYQEAMTRKGYSRSFIVACPLANILNVNEIRPKLRKVFTYPADADSLRFVGTYE